MCLIFQPAVSTEHASALCKASTVVVLAVRSCIYVSGIILKPGTRSYMHLRLATGNESKARGQS